MTSSIRNYSQSYELEDDPLQGFNRAVYNGQTRLALEYAVLLFDSILTQEAPATTEAPEYQSQIDELKEDLKKVKASLAPFRKVTKGGGPPPTPPPEPKSE